jgi:hypothetical protein
MSVMFVTFLVIGCEKEYDDVPNVPDPVVSVGNHTYFEENLPVNQFDYSFGNVRTKNTLMLKSATAIGDTAIRFIRFTSYHSADEGQRNIHEIQAYDASGANILLNDSTLTFESNRSPQHDYNQLENVVDGDTTELGRWASLRWVKNTPDSVEYYANLKHFSDSLNNQFASAENDSMLNDIINNTEYFDTVYFTVVLKEPATINRLVLYLGYHTQIFDVDVSSDGENWTLLKPEDYDTINE